MRFLAALYLGFTSLASVIILVTAGNLRGFFAARDAALVGDSVQLLLVAMALVLWSSAIYMIWKDAPRASFK